MRLWCLYLKHKSKMTKRKGVSKTPIFLISGIRKCGQFLTLPTYVLDPAYLCKYHPVLKTILAKEFWHLICLSGWQSNKWSESSYDLLLHPYSWVWCWVLKGLVEYASPLFWICNAPDLCGCGSSAWITFLLPAHSHPHTTFPLRWVLLWARHNFNGNSSWKYYKMHFICGHVILIS